MAGRRDGSAGGPEPASAGSGQDHSAGGANSTAPAPGEEMTHEQRRARTLTLLASLGEALAETDRLDLLAVGARLSGALDLLRIEAARVTNVREPPWPKASS